MQVFVTGAAGFIGFHASRFLLEQGVRVAGYDSLNDYYDPRYKQDRLEVLRSYDGFTFTQGDLADNAALTKAWEASSPSHVLHLAAQAGVRYSLTNPEAYIQSNVVGFQNIIELARHAQPEHFVYASSSSVYGGNTELPFHEEQDVSRPISLYAATKIGNELVARTYNHLYNLKATGLRFFTVYGPFGRPDMAMFKFARRMLAGEAIPVFNNGRMVRDFTYVDDVVDGIWAALNRPADAAVYNLGRGKREVLGEMIAVLERTLGVSARLDLMPMQPGDVAETSADVSRAREHLGYEPKVTIDVGIPRLVDWMVSSQDAGKIYEEKG